MRTAAAQRQRRAFLEGRQRYIGGSDVPAILGVSKWSTPLQVYREKTEPVQDVDSGTLAMRRGLALEDFIADEFTRARPEFVTFRSRPIWHDRWGFPAGASVDRLVARTEKPRTPVAVLEAKTAFRYGWREWDEKTGELPDAYYLQQQWYLAVTGLPLSYGVADVGDPDRVRIVSVKADRRIQRRCIEAARDFWRDHILTGTPPDPSGTRGDAEALRGLYPDTIPEPPVPLDAEVEQMVDDYLTLKTAADAAATEAEAAKQRLCALMGPHERAQAGRWQLSWKTQTRQTLDTKALREAHPDIAGEFSRTSESRVFAKPRETT